MKLTDDLTMQKTMARSPLEVAALKAAGKFYGETAAIDPASIAIWAQLIFTLVQGWRECRANRAEASEPEQLIQAAQQRRLAHVVRARAAAREHFGWFRRREIVRAAEAVLDAGAESTPEEVEELLDDLESR